ncbi:hypothetical protein RUND412_005133 [Rhizina undulata]
MPSTTVRILSSSEETIPLPSELPELPVSASEFLDYVNKNPDVPIRELLQPFLAYESVLRSYFAQDPDNALVKGHIGLISLFENDNAAFAKIRARDLATETTEEKERYVMPLKDEDRKANGAPAIVGSLEEFRKNFTIFTESSLLNLDWNNVIAAGSSVVTPLLCIPEKYRDSKRAIRGYYHEELTPASDIDLFIHGLTDPKEALAKMLAIEKTVRDNLLCETTTVRTRNTVTIVSQYPNRHVQIVLRLYKSAAQILAGFDVNCACVAYDGSRVFANPRSIASYMMQCNDIDLTRRSPSYENRLSKYSHRGFEVYCPFLDRSKIDPTIFERSFNRTQGLARLLVLERLPKPDDRDQYVLQRKMEKGRPVRIHHSTDFHKKGNLKVGETDEVAEWNFEDESGYQKFAIPYGKEWYATKIEKFFYRKDLFLNAEWNPVNKPPHRTVNLHRHPVFFGSVDDVAGDCCGFCPEPIDDEEIKAQEEEDKIYVRGPITFMKEDPGRQEIGSFYPLGPEYYTDMAYVGSTELICLAIVDDDADYVRRWCLQEGADVNRRDFCGRTPLQLAVLSTTTSVEVVQALVDNGARLVSRLQDGRTALHLAAARGSVEMVKVLLKKSEENEHERDLREEVQKNAQKEKEKVNEKAKAKVKGNKVQEGKLKVNLDEEHEDEDEEDDDEDYEEISKNGSDDHGIARTSTTSSFIKIKKPEPAENFFDGEEIEDDVYDINVVDWDFMMSPLHHAIIGGHTDVIRTLVSDFGADPLLPIKILGNDKSPVNAILSLTLAYNLPKEKAAAAVTTLLQLGASSAQANSFSRVSALHYAVWHKAQEIVSLMFDIDGPAASSVVNQIGKEHERYWSTSCASPLITAMKQESPHLANILLEHGVRGKVTLEEFIQALHRDDYNVPLDQRTVQFENGTRQPIEIALWNENTLPLFGRLLAAGADPSTITILSYNSSRYFHFEPTNLMTILDLVHKRIETYRKFLTEADKEPVKEELRPLWDISVLDQFPEGSYSRLVAERTFNLQNMRIRDANRDRFTAKEETTKEKAWKKLALEKKKAAAQQQLELYEKAEKQLIDSGAKSYFEIFPEKKSQAPFSAEPAGINRIVEPEVPKGFTVSFNFPDLTSKNEGYKALFEAVWSGDAHTIKMLTLGPSGEGENKIPALRISICDMNGLSTFAIALHRGHRDIAKLILDIAQTQYQPNQGSAVEKYVFGDKEIMDIKALNENNKDDDLVIYKKLIDDEFTIENLGARSDLVKCGISPMDVFNYKFDAKIIIQDAPIDIDMIRWNVVTIAVYDNDLDLLRYLLKLAKELHSQGAMAVLQWEAVELAAKLNRIEFLEELMESVSFGIDYEALENEENDSGEETRIVDPKFYPGLTVRGKKLKEWAKKANPGYSNNRRGWSPRKIMEFASYNGCLDSIKWLLSSKPLACLQHYMANNQEDGNVKLLMKQGPKLGELLKSSLGTDIKAVSHLLLKGWRDDSLDTLKYFMTELGLSEAKCNHGTTPALYAARLLRKSALRFMAPEEVGVNFAARDLYGKNIAHKLLEGWTVYMNNNKWNRKVKSFIEFLDIIPPNILSEAWRQRTFKSQLTPLAWYLSQNASIHIPTVTLILEYSKGDDLKIPDGEGNWPIHVLFQRGFSKVAKIVLDVFPDMLFKENAVGRTPIEIITDQYLIHVSSNPLLVVLAENEYGSAVDEPLVVDKPLEDFREKETENEESDFEFSSIEKMHAFALKSASEAISRKRQLVGLLDASELAKRVTKNAKDRNDLGGHHEPSICQSYTLAKFEDINSK